MSDPVSPTTLWLSCADTGPLQTLINDLAQALGRPIFTAHMTVLGEIPASAACVRAAVERALAVYGPLSADALPRGTGLVGGDFFFQAIMIRLSVSPQFAVQRSVRTQTEKAFVALRQHLIDEFKPGFDAPWRPHVSLCYTPDGAAGLAKLEPGEAAAVTGIFRRNGLTEPSLRALIEGEPWTVEVPCPAAILADLRFTHFDVMECPLGDLSAWRSLECVPLV